MTSLLLPGSALADVFASIVPLASKDAVMVALTHVRLQLDNQVGRLLCSATDRYVMGFCRRDVGVDPECIDVDVLIPAALAKQVATLARKAKTIWLDLDGDRVAFRDAATGATFGGQTGEAWREKWPNIERILDTALDRTAVRSIPLSFDLAKMAQFGPAAKVAKEDPVFWTGAEHGIMAVRIGHDFAGGCMALKIPDATTTETARTFLGGFTL